MRRIELINYLDQYLRVPEIKDYGPQGLQVEAERSDVHRVALAVDTAPPIIEAAAAWDADMLLVHHGILWRSVEPIRGPLGMRVRRLLKHGMNLYAAHLPLDAHPEVGNNAVLARLFDVEIQEWWCEPTNVPLGVIGAPPVGTTLDTLVERVAEALHTQPRVLAHGPAEVGTVAIVSGDAVAEAPRAQLLGADTFITGETSHAHYWAAADLGMNIVFAGHYATETVGVQALGSHLSERFGLEVQFFDFPTEM
ncbi:MAG: Nif3-like dinuclear metal center hexameric protein [Candidatus Promineifilaceae bacterium]|nr:Nif3-like dinuclear metal center hexameric protein [Candidatus Promineifilaceae bacterium]